MGIKEIWESISQGARDNIVGTVIGGVILAAGLFIFRKSIGAFFRRVFAKPSAPDQLSPPARVELIVKTEQPQTPQRVEEVKAAPPVQTTRATVANLPRPPAVGFVARHDQNKNKILARLEEDLAPQKHQLVVLWGDGGVGKTTLAAEAVRAMSKVFSRVVWTSADGRLDFSLSTLLDEIATQLGEPETRKLALEPKKEAVQMLIAADTVTLVVLDNFETVSPDEQQHCAEWIAGHAPCPALITTRERVNMNNARNISIDVMSPPEAKEFLERLIAQANPRTFAGVDRARIIRAADANPLVMQWVIAQIELAQHPNDVLDDLSHGKGDAAQRVFDRSFNLPQLGNDGRDALLALSLFTPSASRIALAEVAGFDKDVSRLREAAKRLAALCLIEMIDAGERLIIKGLTRDLAKAHLSNDERAAEFRRRFVDCFLRYAESHAKTTPEDFDALETEKDNVLGAMDVAFEMKDWKSVMHVMTAIGSPARGFLSLHGYWDEAIQRGDQAVEAAQAAKDEWMVAMFVGNAATIRKDRGEYEQARDLYQQVLDVFKKLGSEINISVALHQLGMIAQAQGKIEEAQRFYGESLEIDKKLGDQSGIAITFGQLGLLAEIEGNNTEAARLFREALTIFEKLKSPNAEIARRSLKRIEGRS